MWTRDPDFLSIVSACLPPRGQPHMQHYKLLSHGLKEHCGHCIEIVSQTSAPNNHAPKQPWPMPKFSFTLIQPARPSKATSPSFRRGTFRSPPPLWISSGNKARSSGLGMETTTPVSSMPTYTNENPPSTSTTSRMITTIHIRDFKRSQWYYTNISTPCSGPAHPAVPSLIPRLYSSATLCR
ncbi:hypothetical protein Cgig2_025057 [Carnegiea gigantea]|uniref:Uncharacterized protein n=1 Tax=Carnegiea gigantea TaxID=171969 RepID=A0A9Q1H0V9_9CARY|nr:hypothetical protein Cgig2_025057 [Carnegiea gigantea]